MIKETKLEEAKYQTRIEVTKLPTNLVAADFQVDIGVGSQAVHY